MFHRVYQVCDLRIIGIEYVPYCIFHHQQLWSTNQTTVRRPVLYLLSYLNTYIDSMADKSSFRNSIIDRTPLS